MAHPIPSTLSSTCDGLFFCLAEWANTVTFGMFWTFITFAFGMVLLLITFRMGTPRSFGYASVSTLLVSLWLTTLGLMTWWIASVFIIAGLIGFVGMILNER